MTQEFPVATTPSPGLHGVDWENRVDFARLRDYRLARVKEQLEASDLGAVLLFETSNIRYATSTHIGYWAFNKGERYALVTRTGPPRIWDFGSAAKAHRLQLPQWFDETNSIGGNTGLQGAISPIVGLQKRAAEELRSVLKEDGVADMPLGVDLAETSVFLELQRAGIDVRDGQQVMMLAREIKSNDEITLLTQACAMVDGVYQDIFEFLKPGVRESDVVALAHARLFEMGSEFVEAVNSIAGERCSPHPHVFSDRLIRPGDPAFFDILHSYNGYRTCYYRTFAVGSASSAQRDAYTRAREYMDRAIALVRPGATTADIVEVWPEAQEFGFADEEAAFALQYGHGVGLSIWEKPIFSRLVSLDHPEVLEEGMVFALETYWPASDGWGAARIEEEVVVTADGCEVITKFPAEELLVAGRRYYTVDGPLDLRRDSQSHLNTTWGRGEA
jgi:Xaa-Pro aminopeptidase